MKKYNVTWHYPINETELKILLEEWSGFITIEEVKE